jgi:FLVCR family MFS transporter 7
MSQPRVFGYRFVELAVFSIANAVNAVMWISFAPVTTATSKYYGVTSTLVNLLSVVFLAFYLPATVLSMYVYARFSLRVGLLIGTVLTVIGCWIRYGSASSQSYGVLLLGQIFAAIAQPFFTNVPAKVAARWFPAEQRAAACSVGSLFNPIGIAVGTVIPTGFIGQDLLGNPTGFDQMLLCEALMATGAFVLVLFFFRDKPDVPPSSSQETLLSHESELKNGFSMSKLISEARHCLADRDFFILFVTFGIGLGLFNSMTTVIEQLTNPFGATSDDASLFGGVMIGVGLVGAGIAGVYLDRTHKYIVVLRIGFVGGVFVLLALTLVMSTGSIEGVRVQGEGRRGSGWVLTPGGGPDGRAVCAAGVHRAPYASRMPGIGRRVHVSSLGRRQFRTADVLRPSLGNCLHLHHGRAHR